MSHKFVIHHYHQIVIQWFSQAIRPYCPLFLEAPLYNIQSSDWDDEFTNPTERAECVTTSILKRCLTDLNSGFYFSLAGCFSIIKKQSLPNYFPIGGRRIVGFTSFSKAITLGVMQRDSSMIWTRDIKSIFNDDNHYLRWLNLRFSSLANTGESICRSIQINT